MSRLPNRRSVRVGVAGVLLALVAVGCGAPGADSPDPGDGGSKRIPEKPAKPVTLDILDVAGNLQLTQGMIDAFVKEHPDVIAEVTYSKAPAPDLAGKIKAQQQAGRVQVDLVLTGTDGLAAGIAQNLWSSMAEHQSVIGTPDYLEPAAEMQKLAQGRGTAIVYYPSGPLYEYDPEKVAQPPRTPGELLAWAKANPKRFQYADPANSGPGRTFLMGLPYLLGDKDPRDPVNGWEKTWAYLKELDKYIGVYGSGTTETMKNLASGQVDMIMTTTGWYINPRALGTVPQRMRAGHFDAMTWVTDAQYAVVPKGVDADTMSAALQLVRWMLTPEQQAKAYDDGYFYPGPAIKNVPLSMAPEKSRATLREFGVPEFDRWIDTFPKKPSLPADQQVKAFDLWNREVAGG
ncbi:ABC transporter substrate-binding protein [Streptomyces sp. NPDC057638]|uniref:ABC transporter substrate-binding protein n=1 Tax=Streptomyces sp. NPDC057638 TaxID=3346190 RepID=UPI00369FBE64